MSLFIKSLLFACNVYIISTFIVILVIGIINLLNKIIVNNKES